MSLGYPLMEERRMIETMAKAMSCPLMNATKCFLPPR